jgi:pyridoxal phosphate enzyme (YggS family)
MLAGRLAAVEERIDRACRRAGRSRADVTLVAVTKTVNAEVAALMPALGVRDFGESRPQELWRKAAGLPVEVGWHLIGHLQRNKIERTVPLVQLVHAVDSVRLLHALEEDNQRDTIRVLLEVNASGEANKQGFAPDALPSLAADLAGLKRVRVEGLMTMAAYEEDAERCRPTFTLLRTLRDRLQTTIGDAHRLRHLSMGMSNDFEIAIEEGATLVRLGTVLFEGMEGTEP